MELGGGSTHSPALQTDPLMQSVLRMQVDELAQPTSSEAKTRGTIQRMIDLQRDTDASIQSCPKYYISLRQVASNRKDGKTGLKE